jgi:hypothetical protein
VEAYRDLFVGTTAALLDGDDPVLLDYLRHDLRDIKVRLSAQIVTEDAVEVFFGKEYWRDLNQHSLAVPTRMLVAEWAPLLVEYERVPGDS